MLERKQRGSMTKPVRAECLPVGNTRTGNIAKFPPGADHVLRGGLKFLRPRHDSQRERVLCK